MRLWRLLGVGVGVGMVLASVGTAAAQEEVQVPIEQYEFVPKELVIPAGTTVTWINNDAVAHTVTADDRSYDSGLFSHLGTYSITFDAPGTYGYFCLPHGSPGSGMAATVIVLGDEEMAPAPEDMAPPEDSATD
jgi:plastocyanin